jgi:hypothetical protein
VAFRTDAEGMDVDALEGQPQPVLAALDQEGWAIRVGTFSKFQETPVHAFPHCVALSA